MNLFIVREVQQSIREQFKHIDRNLTTFESSRSENKKQYFERLVKLKRKEKLVTSTSAKMALKMKLSAKVNNRGLTAHGPLKGRQQGSAIQNLQPTDFEQTLPSRLDDEDGGMLSGELPADILFAQAAAFFEKNRIRDRDHAAQMHKLEVAQAHAQAVALMDNSTDQMTATRPDHDGGGSPDQLHLDHSHTNSLTKFEAHQLASPHHRSVRIDTSNNQEIEDTGGALSDRDSTGRPCKVASGFLNYAPPTHKKPHQQQHGAEDAQSTLRHTRPLPPQSEQQQSSSPSIAVSAVAAPRVDTSEMEIQTDPDSSLQLPPLTSVAAAAPLSSTAISGLTSSDLGLSPLEYRVQLFGPDWAKQHEMNKKMIQMGGDPEAAALMYGNFSESAIEREIRLGLPPDPTLPGRLVLSTHGDLDDLAAQLTSTHFRQVGGGGAGGNRAGASGPGRNKSLRFGSGAGVGGNPLGALSGQGAARSLAHARSVSVSPDISLAEHSAPTDGPPLNFEAIAKSLHHPGGGHAVSSHHHGPPSLHSQKLVSPSYTPYAVQVAAQNAATAPFSASTQFSTASLYSSAIAGSTSRHFRSPSHEISTVFETGSGGGSESDGTTEATQSLPGIHSAGGIGSSSGTSKHTAKVKPHPSVSFLDNSTSSTVKLQSSSSTTSIHSTLSSSAKPTFSSDGSSPSEQSAAAMASFGPHSHAFDRLMADAIRTLQSSPAKSLLSNPNSFVYSEENEPSPVRIEYGMARGFTHSTARAAAGTSGAGSDTVEGEDSFSPSATQQRRGTTDSSLSASPTQRIRDRIAAAAAVANATSTDGGTDLSNSASLPMRSSSGVLHATHKKKRPPPQRDLQPLSMPPALAPGRNPSKWTHEKIKSVVPTGLLSRLRGARR